MRKTKICAQEKLHTVKSILRGTESILAAAKRLSVGQSSVRDWICSYKGNGIEAFTYTRNKHYSHECKVQAVTAYLNQEGSLAVICQRFGLRSSTQLRTWIKQYNSHEKLKASGTGGFSPQLCGGVQRTGKEVSAHHRTAQKGSKPALCLCRAVPRPPLPDGTVRPACHEAI